jgi:hypothetical protein
MKSFAIPDRVEDEKAREQEIREFLRQWVGLLADRKFSEALGHLSPEILPGSGSVDSRKAPLWTPALLAAVIANYGTPEPVEGQPQSYAVVPLDSSLREPFDANVTIDFDRDAIAGLDRGMNLPEVKPRSWLATRLRHLGWWRSTVNACKTCVGGVDFALPINFARGNDLSDLSARMLFKPVGSGKFVLVLLDIHVL